MLIDQIENDLVQGPEGVVKGWRIDCTFTNEEMYALQLAYDPSSSTSPAAAVCRPIVRQMLDAVLAYTPDGS